MRRFYVLILALLILVSSHAQKHDLGLKLEIGKSYKQNTSSNSTINQSVNGQAIDMIVELRGGMTYIVKSINGGNYEMDAIYDSLWMKIQSPQGVQESSSEETSEDDIFSMILAEMKDKPFFVKMSKTGRILEVKNINALFDSVFKKFPELPAAEAEQIKAQLSKSYGPDAFKGSIEMLTAVLPDRPVARGDSWEVKSKLESGMTADVNSVFKLIDIQPGFYIIKGDAKIQTTNKDEYREANGMMMKQDLGGTMVSEIKIDNKTGWIIQATMNQEIKGDVHIKESPQLPGGMKIPMTVKSEVKVRND